MLFVSPGCSHGDHLVPIAKARFVEWQGFLQVGVSHSSLHGGDVLGQLHVRLLTSEKTLEVTARFFHQQDGLLQMIQVNATGSVHEGVATSQLEHFEVPVGHFCLTDVFMFCHAIGQTFAFAAIGYQFNSNGVRKFNFPAKSCWVSQVKERIRPLGQSLVITRLNQVGIDLSWSLGVVSLVTGLAETKQATTSIPSLQEGVELVFSLTTIQQLNGSTEQQHIGGRLTVQLFTTNRVSGVLGQLLLDDPLVIQLKEQVQYLNVTDEVGTDFVNLKVDGSTVGHQQLMTQLLHRWRCTGVEGERIGTGTMILGLGLIELLLLV